MLDQKGILTKDQAVKSCQLDAFNKLKDGKLLLSLGPR